MDEGATVLAAQPSCPSSTQPSTQEGESVTPLACSAVLTHHWLVRVRGGEKVLAALCELLPDAPLYTLVHDPASVGDAWPPVHTSFLNVLPGVRRHYPKLLPLMPLAARSMRLPPVDLVVCSDAALAKAMRAAPRSRVVCYCHSPMRYVWEETIACEYRRTWPRLAQTLWNPVASYVRAADCDAAQRVDVFVANSQHVAARIRRCYGRDSVVVYPPVDLPREPTIGPRDDYYLCVGHHAPYKRLDLAIAACEQLGRTLVVIGDGPDLRRMRPRASERIRFMGFQPDRVVRDHYRRARALLFPGEEDFGIVPVEAMAHGCPVIAYAVGGATETVINGQTGLLFEEQSVDALVAAMQRAETTTFDPAVMRRQMQRFSRPRFLREMRAICERALRRMS